MFSFIVGLIRAAVAYFKGVVKACKEEKTLAAKIAVPVISAVLLAFIGLAVVAVLAGFSAIGGLAAYWILLICGVTTVGYLKCWACATIGTLVLIDVRTLLFSID